jgi:hypothetical protein
LLGAGTTKDSESARIIYVGSLILPVTDRKERNINVKAERNQFRAIFIETVSRCIPTMPEFSLLGVGSQDELLGELVLSGGISGVGGSFDFSERLTGILSQRGNPAAKHHEQDEQHAPMHDASLIDQGDEASAAKNKPPSELFAASQKA